MMPVPSLTLKKELRFVVHQPTALQQNRRDCRKKGRAKVVQEGVPSRVQVEVNGITVVLINEMTRGKMGIS